MAQGTGEVDEIRAQIEHTRAEITETIDAIHARLSPEQLAAQAKEHVKRAAVDPLTAGAIAATLAALGIRALRQPRTRADRWKRRMTAAACVGLVCCSAAALRVRNHAVGP
jgi:hypothetical protein